MMDALVAALLVEICRRMQHVDCCFHGLFDQTSFPLGVSQGQLGPQTGGCSTVR